MSAHAVSLDGFHCLRINLRDKAGTMEGDSYTYMLKADHQAAWQVVSKAEFIAAERNAGFRPKLASDDPAYMTTCATGGFSGNGISGQIKRMPKIAASPFS